MRKWISVLAIVLCAPLVFAQGSKKLVFGGITFQEDQFMQTVQQGMKAKAAELGIEMLMGNSDNKIEKEVELINNYIERGVDAICIVPLSADGSIPALKRAADKGIKIVVANIGINADFQSTFIDSNNNALGSGTAKYAVDFIKKKLGGKAKIATLAFESQLKELSNMRQSGFEDVIKKELPNSTIVIRQDAWLPEMGVRVAGDIMTAHPEVNVIWSANEGGTVGATMAVKNAGKAGKVFVFGTDASDQLANFLLAADNILQAVTGQKPFTIGQIAVDSAAKALKGQALPKVIPVGGFSLWRGDASTVKTFLKDPNKMQ
ncbi:MAG: substrate-binding domain-containing protein [Rectinemataceae bacterium]|jgi:simple sugar transport system substrate-binding protein/ribose transport system substrate-binding protein